MYKRIGNWTIWLFLGIIAINMFTVTAAIGGVCAGLFVVLIPSWPLAIETTVVVLLALTYFLLLLGGFRVLNIFIKGLSIVLLFSVTAVFIALLFSKSQSSFPTADSGSALLEGSGLALLVSLLGWMPAGMEASVMNSIWVVRRSRDKKQSLQDVMFDFRSGYLFTGLLALLFLAIGALAVYGTGMQLEGNSIAFTAALMAIFTGQLGVWSHWFFGLAAFATIYGTLIVVLDAFARCMVQAIALLKDTDTAIQESKESRPPSHKSAMLIIAIGASLLFIFLRTDMIKMLELATTIAFVCTPVIAYLNYRSITSMDAALHGLSARTLSFARICLFLLALFSLYYISVSILT